MPLDSSTPPVIPSPVTDFQQVPPQTSTASSNDTRVIENPVPPPPPAVKPLPQNWKEVKESSGKVRSYCMTTHTVLRIHDTRVFH